MQPVSRAPTPDATRRALAKLTPKGRTKHTAMCALAVAERGGKVFPMRFIKDPKTGKTRKVPAIKGWPQNATVDPEQIKPMFARLGLGIGIATEPSGWVVIDTDQKPGIDGDANLRALLGEHAHYLDETETVLTPTGSKHYRFTGDPVKSTASILAPGVDIKSRGGYVVGEGTIRGNGTYRIVANAGTRLPLPQAIIDIIAKAYTAEAKPVALTADVDLDTRAAIANVTRYLSHDAQPAIEGSGGDAQTYAVACEVRDMGISEAVAFDLMAEHYNPRCNPSWEPGDIENPEDDTLAEKIANAYRYASNPKPGVKSIEAEFDVIPDEAEAAEAEALAEVRLLKDIDADDAVILALIRKHAAAGAQHEAREAEEAGQNGDDDDMITADNVDELHARASGPSVIQGVALCGTLVTLIGPQKAGKTFIALDLEAAIATPGALWAGRKVAHGVALHVLCEGRGGGRKRVKALKVAGRLREGAPLVVWTTSIDLSKGDRDAKRIIQRAKKLSAKYDLPVQIITIDTLARAGAGDEGTEAMGKVIKQLDAIRTATGAMVLPVHHTGYGDKMRGRGSSALPGAIDAELLLDKAKKEIVFQNFRDFEEPDPISYRIVSVDTDWRDEYGAPITSAVVDYPAADPAKDFSPLAGLETGQLDVILAAVATEKWRTSDKSPDYLGYAIANVLGIELADCDAKKAGWTDVQKGNRETVDGIIGQMIKDDRITVEDRKIDGQRKKKPTYVIKNAAQ